MDTIAKLKRNLKKSTEKIREYEYSMNDTIYLYNHNVLKDLRDIQYYSNKITELRKTYPNLIKIHNRNKFKLKQALDKKSLKHNI